MRLGSLVVMAVLPLPFAGGRGAFAGQAGMASVDPAMGVETLRLWTGAVPDAKGTAADDTPTLTVLRPSNPNGTAVIVAPGGGYVQLATVKEGREPGDFLASLGVTVFVLKYRLGPKYLYPVPLEDARRAVRMVRSLAGKYGYSPDRIGMMGFSAGGHLTAMVGVEPQAGKAGDADPVEREGSELDFMVLGYPWLNAMQPQVRRATGPMINYCSVAKGLTQADCRKLEAEYTPVHHVSDKTPPTFLYHTTDDGTVPVETSLEFCGAMVAHGRDCELHDFSHGPHGSGLGGDDPALREWPHLLELWLGEHGWLKRTH